MPKHDTLLEDGLRSELMLRQQLKALSEALRQQLQETEKKQKEELERRIHQNSLLSTDVDRESGDGNELKHQVKETLHHPRQSEEPKSSSPAWVSSNWKNCSVRASTLTPARTQQCERLGLSKTTEESKEEKAEAECQRKFCALPVPDHVIQPLYQEMMELKEKERKQGHEQRRDFLLSIQRPFSFQEREQEKREKLTAMLSQVSHDQKTASVRKPRHKEVKDSSDSELKGGFPFIV